MGSKEFPILVELVLGNLANEESDVIVCLNDEMLSNEGLIALKLLKAAGPEVERECQRLVSEKK